MNIPLKKEQHGHTARKRSREGPNENARTRTRNYYRSKDAQIACQFFEGELAAAETRTPGKES